ncbi:MAG TPA: hypothetical protein P5096_03285 [Patescibacteria group bacterium]|nr:hypothetical protein [Patescibacteria group bacterium]
MKKTTFKKIAYLFLSTLIFCALMTPFSSYAADLAKKSGNNFGITRISIADTDYPLTISISSDKNIVFNNGLDIANLKVRIANSKKQGISGINIKFSSGGRDIINPPENTTDNNGIAYFKVSSTQEHISNFQFSLRDPTSGEIYSSNVVAIKFLSQSRFSMTVNSIADFKNNTATKEAAAYVVAPAATAVIAVSAFSPIINLLSSIFPYLNYLFNVILQFFGIRRKQKPWGILYDSMTKEPIDLGTVRLFDAKTKNIVQTATTDKSGRFGFPPLSGKYYLTAAKYQFGFPSKLLKGAVVDGKYHGLYFGDKFNLKKNQKLTISVPIDLATAVTARLRLIDRLKAFSEKISRPFLVVSLMVTLVMLWINTTLYNEILIILYILMILTMRRIRTSAIIPWGIIYDSKTKKPLKSMPIKVFDKKYNKLLETRVSDEAGRFTFILPKGEYYFKIADFHYQIDLKAKELGGNKNYHGEIFKVEENEVLRFNIPLKSLK